MEHKEYLQELNKRDTSLRNIQGMILVIMVLISVIIFIVGFTICIASLIYSLGEPLAIIFFVISLLFTIGLAALLFFIYRLIHKYVVHQEYLMDQVKNMGRIVAYKRYNEEIEELKQDNSASSINIMLVITLALGLGFFIYRLVILMPNITANSINIYIDLFAYLLAFIGEALAIIAGIIFFRGKVKDEYTILNINRILITKNNNNKLEYKANSSSNRLIVALVSIGLTLLFIGVALPLFFLASIDKEMAIATLSQIITNIVITVLIIVLVLYLLIRYYKLDNKYKRELQYIINDLSKAPESLYLELSDNENVDLVS